MNREQVKKLAQGTWIHWDFGEWPIVRKKGQRYGQAFLNAFFPEVNDSELFYCNTVAEAKAIIFKHYLTT
jgi:hypothetical protein